MKARKARREIRLAEENIVDQRDVNRMFALWFTRIRDPLQEVPEEFESILPPERRTELREFLQQMIDHRLEGLCQWGRTRLNVDDSRVPGHDQGTAAV